MTRLPSGVSRFSSEASTSASGAPMSGRCRYRAVIFDLDGTLADTEPLVIGCMLETIRAAGYAVTEEQLLHYIGPPLPVMLKNMLGMELDAAQPLYFDYLERYRTKYMPRTAPLPGALELLERLAKLEIPLAVVTNKREDAGVSRSRCWAGPSGS